jgi:hypothetical protein
MLSLLVFAFIYVHHPESGSKSFQYAHMMSAFGKDLTVIMKEFDFIGVSYPVGMFRSFTSAGDSFQLRVRTV